MEWRHKDRVKNQGVVEAGSYGGECSGQINRGVDGVESRDTTGVKQQPGEPGLYCS